MTKKSNVKHKWGYNLACKQSKNVQLQSKNKWQKHPTFCSYENNDHEHHKERIIQIDK